MFKNLIKTLLLGNKWLQSFYELLFKIALKGMNYDRGHVPDYSGEKFVLSLLKANEKKDVVVFDVGANTGQYASMVITTLPHNFQLYSFEPQEEAFIQLKNISNQGYFRPYHLAMGASKGVLDIYFNRAGSVFASMYPSSYQNYDITLNQSKQVAVSTVDDFCTENSIPFIDLLKIDVEGYEIEVLKGCRQMIQNGKIKMIQFEFGLASIKARIFLEDFFLLLKDYDIYRILQNGIRQIHYSEYAELFLTTNYLAIKK
ncbi:MAG: FkbM family methyltransferase [Thermoflexibacter sp.]|jgi:FkbM family methyltransferase|nr:FkbM family methyltransferase [Thermoflexibacter sp.]